jgi:hypothetical protein
MLEGSTKENTLRDCHIVEKGDPDRLHRVGQELYLLDRQSNSHQ